MMVVMKTEMGIFNNNNNNNNNDKSNNQRHCQRLAREIPHGNPIDHIYECFRVTNGPR